MKSKFDSLIKEAYDKIDPAELENPGYTQEKEDVIEQTIQIAFKKVPMGVIKRIAVEQDVDEAINWREEEESRVKVYNMVFKPLIDNFQYEEALQAAKSYGLIQGDKPGTAGVDIDEVPGNPGYVAPEIEYTNPDVIQ